MKERISVSGAKEAVQVFLNQNFCRYRDDNLIVLDDATIEKPYGWIFFYDSQKSMDGDLSYAIVGNGPIAFIRETGEIVVCGAYDYQESICDFESERFGKCFE